MATGGERRESLEQRESETVKMEKSEHKKRRDHNTRKMIIEGHIQIAERKWEELRETQRQDVRRARNTGDPMVDQTWQNIYKNQWADELKERRRELQELIRHNSPETYTKGSVSNREHYVPDTAAVKQNDPGVESTDASTQTSFNQQTQKTSRLGREDSSQINREGREVGEYDGLTHPQIHRWEHPTHSPFTRSKRREQGERNQGTSDNQEGGLLEQDRGSREQTMPEIVIERNLQLTFTQNGPYLNAHNIGDGGERERDRTRRMEEQEDLTLERTIQENEWNIKYAMRTMHEAIWVKQQLIQIQQDRLDQSPSHDINIRTELRTTQRMIREAEELTSTAKDLLTVYSWHKEAWQRRMGEEQPKSHGVGQENQERQEEEQQNIPQIKEAIIKEETTLQGAPLTESRKGQAESF